MAPDRPIDEEKEEAFLSICNLLDNEAENGVYSLEELKDILNESNSQAHFNDKYLRSKLSDRYGDSVYFAKSHKQKTVICFRDKLDDIVNNYRKFQSNDSKEVANMII